MVNVETEVLLTDEFVEFSTKIAAIHAEKKTATEEFRKIYLAYQDKIKVYEEQVAELKKNWEVFASGKKK